MERGHARELRHDFRAIYRVSYDDVPTDEAIDLVLTLPQESRYRAAVDPSAGWSGGQHQMANVIDLLMVINWRLMGCPSTYKPEPMERPGDRELRIQAMRRARRVRERIESTEWEDV